MSSSQVRGYLISSAAAFLRSTVGDAEATRLLSKQSPELQKLVASAKSGEWYPVSPIAELYRTIADAVGGGNEAKAQDALVQCGTYIAREATNTYLKLLMRMLSLSLFSKKMPDFWRRDNTGGKLETELKGDTLICRLSDIDGYDHTGPVAAGFAVFAFGAMGKTIKNLTIHNWSLDKPSQQGFWFELTCN